MTQYDPNDPNSIPRGEPIYSETVIVRRESNTGWWIAGGLAAVVLIAVIWILASGRPDDTEAQLMQAQVEAAEARAEADRLAVQGQIAGAQQSVDIARSDAVRAQAEAIRAASEARTAEARAMTPPAPVIIERQAPAPVAAPSGEAVITSTSPQY